MKRILLQIVFFVCVLAASAQSAIDNFIVGPYIVDYHGKGDVRYRLRDNINLYEFFELQKDTTILAAIVEKPVKNAFQVSGNVGSTRFVSNEFGIEGVWKQKVGQNLYFNGGLSLGIGHTDRGSKGPKRNMLEIGVPLQIELGKLNHQSASLYGNVGITPTFYSTLSATNWNGKKRYDDVRKSGFLVAPSLGFGGNIPVGAVIMRIGVYATYKINCTTSDYDVYHKVAGRMFLGAQIGIVL